MKDGVLVLEHPPTGGRSSGHRFVPLLVALVIAAGSVALGAMRDPALTLIVWGIFGAAWAVRSFALGQVNRPGAVATFGSFLLLGGGLSLAATRHPPAMVAGFVIALTATLSVPTILRKRGSAKQFDLGAALALLVALAMAAFIVEIVISGGFDPLWTSWFIVTTIAGWTGYWAWMRGRWLVAAGAFFASIAWPLGLFLVVNVPVSFGLFVASLARAWRDRPSMKYPVGAGPGL